MLMRGQVLEKWMFLTGLTHLHCSFGKRLQPQHTFFSRERVKLWLWHLVQVDHQRVSALHRLADYIMFCSNGEERVRCCVCLNLFIPDAVLSQDSCPKNVGCFPVKPAGLEKKVSKGGWGQLKWKETSWHRTRSCQHGWSCFGFGAGRWGCMCMCLCVCVFW